MQIEAAIPTSKPVEMSNVSPLFNIEVLEETSLSTRTKAKASYIYQPGDSSGVIYFLVQGSVKVGTWLENGKEMIKGIIRPGEMFGEAGLSEELTRQDFAKTINEDAVYYQLSTDDIKQLVRDYPAFGLKIMTQLANRLHATEKKLEARICKNARERIVGFLVEKAEIEGIKIGVDEILIKHHLTHREIANLTATSRQTVTTVLNDLKKLDLIYVSRNSILIRNIDKLE